MERQERADIIRNILQENKLNPLDLVYLADDLMSFSWKLYAKAVDPYLDDDELSPEVQYNYEWLKRLEAARATLMTLSPPSN